MIRISLYVSNEETLLKSQTENLTKVISTYATDVVIKMHFAKYFYYTVVYGISDRVP